MAHLRVPGQLRPVDLVIVFVNPAVGRMPPAEQAALGARLQACATSAGRLGNVAMVWQDASGAAGFWAPQNQHAFFNSVSYDYLYSQINLQLNCV